MSGGHFDYIQSRLQYEVIEKLENHIRLNKVEMTEKELTDRFWLDYDKEYIKKYPEEKLHYNHSDETIQEFKNAIESVKKAYIYIQRIDWYLSGDDGEETFHERLKEDLNNL